MRPSLLRHRSWATLLPCLNWPRPSWRSLVQDARAGCSVGLVLVPQAVAYAALAGMPPETGLYAALWPALVGVLWGSAPLLAVGPVALTSLLTAASLQGLATPGSTEWVALAMWLSLYAGLMQLAMGLAGLGRLVDLVSHPVMTGFVHAAAVLIAWSQTPALLGLHAGWMPPLAHGVSLFGLTGASMLASPWVLDLALGLGALCFLVWQRRRWPTFPGFVLVTVLGILVSWSTGHAARGGSVVGSLSAGLPTLTGLPPLGFDQHRALWPAALVIALIGFTEALSSCQALARQQPQPWDENQELCGQGLAKLASAFSGAFPVSASFSRTALNVFVGARSAWSTLFSVLCVLACLLWLTEALGGLPRSVLAAMVIAPVLGLVDGPGLRQLWRLSRPDAALAAATFAATLLAAPQMQWGVFTGVGLSMVAFLWRRMQPRIVEVGLHADGSLRCRQRFGLPALAPGLLALRMDAALSFLTASALLREVEGRCRTATGLHTVLLCGSGINDIDASGALALQRLSARLKQAGIQLSLCALKQPVQARLAQLAEPPCPAGLVFATDRAALAHFQGAIGGAPMASDLRPAPA
ncbi:SulP family inorganic anion transporter [Aquabacterium sp.]|uniref:SulP family inorganic anion transporter n=1 Tax=Aquabacterium sp. TaxID=1872578 RepID=UPI0025B7ADB9|nr:SulP family inorganic anion transporter [Aquabacterium sp.]